MANENMNRVSDHIAKMTLQIADRIAKGLVTQARVDELHKTLDMGLEEYCQFQELKSLASTDGTLTMDEAMTIYRYLGESPETFNNQPIAVKSVLTNILKELMDKRIKQKNRNYRTI